MLFGCGFRRSELVGLELDDIQMRQGHWAVVDLIGKGGHIRTVPIPAWVKAALDQWTCAANIKEGKIFRRVARLGKVWGAGLSQNVVWYVVRNCCEKAGLEHIAPHDLRRTCAKLCHDRGGEIEQIQFLLGHASVQTTERYLGCKQNLGHPVNDLFDLRMGANKQAKEEECVTTNSAGEAAETVDEPDIGSRYTASGPKWPVCDSKQVPTPDRTHLVEFGEGQRPQSLLRCSKVRMLSRHTGNNAEGKTDQGTRASLGVGEH
jgi:hypothetical protein